MKTQMNEEHFFPKSRNDRAAAGRVRPNDPVRPVNPGQMIGAR